uniref:Candidate secreted effector n=1 Tax=Meloidogyne incognita TaxID=6306 RepID=A0A914NJT1_MELIC
MLITSINNNKLIKNSSVDSLLQLLWCSTWWLVQYALLFMLMMVWMLQLLLMSSDVLYMDCWCGAGVCCCSWWTAVEASIAVEMCSTLWIVQHGHWRKCILMVVRRSCWCCLLAFLLLVGGHASVCLTLCFSKKTFLRFFSFQVLGSCTVAGGMLLL